MPRRRTPSIPSPKPPIDVEEAARLLAEGHTYVEIGKKLGFRPSSVRRRLLEKGNRPTKKASPRNARWGDKLYAVWKGMRRRAKARGLEVAAAWKSFEAFYEWALAAGYRPGHALSRKNTGSAYSPGNCIWRARPSAGATATTADDVARRRLYQSWHRMWSRCIDPHDPAYSYYGAKGARVARKWSEFEPFYTWARQSGWKPGLCLTRRGKARVFSPANCRWVTRAEAARAASHPSSRMPAQWTVTAFGETKGPTEWSRDGRCAVTLAGLLQRLRKGWEPEEAIATPPQRGAGPRPRRTLKAFGVTKSVTEWAGDRRCKVTLVTLLRRLDRGVPAEEAITSPPYQAP